MSGRVKRGNAGNYWVEGMIMGFAAGQRKRDEEGCIGYPGTGGRHLLELLCFWQRQTVCLISRIWGALLAAAAHLLFICCISSSVCKFCRYQYVIIRTFCNHF